MAVGQEILTYCSSCKLNLKHTIVAHKSGNTGAIAKVKCHTCQKIHAHRNDPGAAASVAAAKRKASGAPAREKVQIIPVEVEWREQLSSRANAPQLPYAPSKEYKEGDVIEHPTFGCGVVKSLKDGNKFEAIFQRDVKVLIHKLKEA